MIEKILNHAGKLFVATFAVACAAFLPRIITTLSTSDPHAEIELFGWDYIVLSVILSVAIGAGVMLTAWAQPLDPPKIFALALGFPAVISGGLNMTASVNSLETKSQEVNSIAERLLQENAIPTIAPLTVEPVAQAPGDHAIPNSFAWNLGIVSAAQAGEPLKVRRPSFNPGRILNERRYLVTLFETKDKATAVTQLRKIQQAMPGASIVRGSDKNFYIVRNLSPVPISRASVQAVEARAALMSQQLPTNSLKLLPLGR